MALLSHLYSETYGRGPRIVLVHGFTQTRNCWGPIVHDLQIDHEVMVVDAPGHGRSREADADLWRSADLLVETGGPAIYVGYSMGGRMALHAALHHPDHVRALVLLGATAGIDDTDERTRRRKDDEALARQIEELGVADFLDRWLALPLFAGLTPETDCRTARLENDATALAASLRAAGTGGQQPVWGRLGELDMPVLCLAGREDEKFRDLAARLSAAIGDSARAEWIEGAGHTAHLEAPQAFLAVLRRWLEALEAA